MSQEKIEGNNICDDGENLWLDKDCQFYFNNFIEQMWFIRIVGIVSIILILMKHRAFPFAVLLFVTLLFYNGLGAGDATINQDVQTSNIDCMGMDLLKNLPNCLWRSNPVIGWMIIIAVVGYILYRILK